MVWSRLIPVDMNSDDLETVLHRSHHAVAYGGSLSMDGDVAPGPSQHWLLLWGGFGKDMSLLNDLWVIVVYPAGACVGMSRYAWWAEAWCWTAKLVTQSGQVPDGRAYSQLTMLKACLHHAMCLWASSACNLHAGVFHSHSARVVYSSSPEQHVGSRNLGSTLMRLSANCCTTHHSSRKCRERCAGGKAGNSVRRLHDLLWRHHD
jgi:hypothetical protein